MKNLKFHIFIWTILYSLFMNGIQFSQEALANDNRVVIYTSTPEDRLNYITKRLNEQFPQYEIIMEFMNTGQHAAKLKAEGLNSECDITLDLEVDYLRLYNDILAPLDYDYSIYLDEVIPETKTYLIGLRSSSAVVINPDIMKEKGLTIPETYADLLKPEYKGLISMPNPKTSGTGYHFLKILVNTWGEDEAFAYFDALSENILQFTSSGSGPINALVLGEVAIGLAMTPQAVLEINKGGNLEFIELEGVGVPYSFTGYGVIKGKETRKPVMDIMDFFYSTLMYEATEKFFPEPIFKNKVFHMPNYPQNMVYGNMNNNTAEEKQRLLDIWEY